MNLVVNSPDELPIAADSLLSAIGDQKVLLFYGDMGAGKTTFIKSICNALGVTDTVSSPTFSIVNEYRSPAGSVFHFDFYRLKTESEALDLGFEDYAYSGNFCLIEWPEKIPNLLPQHVVEVRIEALSENARAISVEAV